MTTSALPFTEQRLAVGPAELLVRRAGAGRPALVLHGAEGDEGWLALYDALVASHDVLAPSHPGYGYTEAPEWVSEVRHQAAFYLWFLQQHKLTGVDLIGVGLGGWIAAEMAVMSTERLAHLVLVDAMGVKPERSEIFDIFITPWQQVIDRSFHDPKESPEYQRLYGTPVPEFGGVREAGKTMSMRVAFRPYMYDPALPGMLGKVQVPTLVVWGDDDRIAPLECGEIYQHGIPGAQLRILANCGHWAHMERPAELAAVIRDFTAG